MKKLILVICLLITSHLSLGAGDIQLLKAPVNLEDKKSLQRGARNFVNYCLNCHSASYMRYNQLQLIGLSEETIKKDLLFTSDKIGNPMSISMDAVDAKKWFGAPPPNLTVTADPEAQTGYTVTLEVFIETHLEKWVGIMPFTRIQLCHIYYGSFKESKFLIKRPISYP